MHDRGPLLGLSPVKVATYLPLSQERYAAPLVVLHGREQLKIGMPILELGLERNAAEPSSFKLVCWGALSQTCKETYIPRTRRLINDSEALIRKIGWRVLFLYSPPCAFGGGCNVLSQRVATLPRAGQRNKVLGRSMPMHTGLSMWLRTCGENYVM